MSNETTQQPLRRRSADPRTEPWIPGHTLTVTIDSGGVSSRINCTNPELAACRLWCPTCDELCCCFQDWHDAGYCLAVTWIDNGDSPLEVYVGDEKPLVSGPVEVRWDGVLETWTWCYPEAVEQPPTDVLSTPGVQNSPCGPVPASLPPIHPDADPWLVGPMPDPDLPEWWPRDVHSTPGVVDSPCGPVRTDL